MNLAAFFPSYSEENILERISQYHIHTGVDLSTNLNFKKFIWLSNKLEKSLREEKAERDKFQDKLMSQLG